MEFGLRYPHHLAWVAAVLLCLQVSLSAVSAAPKCETLQDGTKCIVSVQSDIMALPNNVSALHVAFRSNHRVSLGPGAFPALPALRLLTVDLQHINAIQPGTFTHLDSLASLILTDSDNLRPLRSKTLQAGVFSGLARLSKLSVQENGINQIDPATFHHLPNLQTLEFVQNDITSLPTSAFTNTTSLVSLKLSRNSLTSIADGSFFGLLRLETLDVSGNKLSALNPETFGNLPNLIILNLENNDIKTIAPNSLQSLSSLQTLKLQQNAIETIDKTMFKSMTGLDSLDLSFNKISAIEDDAFTDLSNLQFLEVFNNDLTEFTPRTFKGLRKLVYLDMYNSNITALGDGIFRDLTDLASLHLHNSKIASIHVNTFSGLEKLNILTLQQNALRTIPLGVFDPLKMLGFLDLSENPWHCTCQMTWMHNWSQGRNFGNELKTKCSNIDMSLLQYAREYYYNCRLPSPSPPVIDPEDTTGSVRKPIGGKGEPSPAAVKPTGEPVSLEPDEEGSTGIKLSDVQKAGIIAAICIVVFIILLVILICYCRRRRCAFWKPPPVQQPPGGVPPTPDKEDKSWLTYFSSSREPNMYIDPEMGSLERRNRSKRAEVMRTSGYDNPAHRADHDDPYPNNKHADVNARVVGYSDGNDVKRNGDLVHAYEHRVSDTGTHYVDRVPAVRSNSVEPKPDGKKEKYKKQGKSSTSSGSGDEEKNPYHDVYAASVAMDTINDTNKIDEGREVHETSMDEPEEGSATSEVTPENDLSKSDKESDTSDDDASSSEEESSNPDTARDTNDELRSPGYNYMKTAYEDNDYRHSFSPNNDTGFPMY